MEPALGPIVERAIFTPQWGHVTDPKRIVDGLRRWLQANGVEFVRGEVSSIAMSGPPSVALSDGRGLSAGKVVVAAGAWSGSLARGLGDPVLLESERGYNTTLPTPAVVLEREVIFAERKFTATPLSCGLRIGGAAEFGPHGSRQLPSQSGARDPGQAIPARPRDRRWHGMDGPPPRHTRRAPRNRSVETARERALRLRPWPRRLDPGRDHRSPHCRPRERATIRPRPHPLLHRAVRAEKLDSPRRHGGHGGIEWRRRRSP